VTAGCGDVDNITPAERAPLALTAKSCRAFPPHLIFYKKKQEELLLDLLVSK
jgi:hypothetical protein